MCMFQIQYVENSSSKGYVVEDVTHVTSLYAEGIDLNEGKGTRESNEFFDSQSNRKLPGFFVFL